MAKVLGECGRYVSQQALRKWDRMLLVAGISMASLGAVWGLFVGVSFARGQPRIFVTIGASVVVFSAFWLIGKFARRKLDELDKARTAMRKGATGEVAVGLRLNDFPDDFHVIHDLSTPFGNLDHVVVGPTGVFILDAKNWRGVVSADGKGELLCNDQPTDKPHVRHFTARLMDVKDKVKTLCDIDPYFQGVFVFTSARVNADWGTTGTVHCIRDDQLWDYIVENIPGKKLTKETGARVAQAFLALATMDKEFKR